MTARILAQELKLGEILQPVDKAHGPRALEVIDGIDAFEKLGAKRALDFAEAVVVGLQPFAVQHGHIHVAHGRLPVIRALKIVGAVPVVAQHGDDGPELRVLQIEHATFAESGEILVRMEGEDAHVAERAGLLSVHLGADGLGCVLDEDDALGRGNGLHHGAQAEDDGGGVLGHVRHVAVEVHDHDGLGTGRHGSGYGLGRGHVRMQIDVAPLNLRALLDIRIRGSGERVRRDDQLVAIFEAAELGGHLKGRGSVADSEAAAFFHALIARKRGLKLLEVMSLGKRLCVAHGFDNSGDFIFRVTDGTAAEINSEFHGKFLLVRSAAPRGNGRPALHT